MKRTLCFAAALLTSACVFAQQDPASGMFWNTLLHMNPATAGLEYRHEAHTQYRNQWDKVNGSPNTLCVNYSARIDKIHGAAGVSGTYATTSYNRRQEALVHYAFHIPVKNCVLAIGISGGVMNQLTAAGWVPPATTDGPSLPANGSNTRFTMNSGVAFRAQNWNAGFSVTRLNAPAFRISESVVYKVARHYYVFADYRFTLSENWSVRPRALFVTDAVRSSGQIDIVGGYKKAWFGVHYRTSDSAGLFAGYDFLDKIRVGYAFEWTTNALSKVSRGTHEITLGFML